MTIKAIKRRSCRVLGKVMGRVRNMAHQLSRPSDLDVWLEKLAESEPRPGLKDRVVVITGSSRGIGFALAEAYLEHGAKVVINGRSQKPLEEALASLKGKGPVAAVCADVATEAGASRLVEGIIAAFGTIDMLINNAAVPGPMGQRAWEVSSEEWANTLRNNVMGPYLCASRVVRWMVEHQVKGRILNVSSGAGVSAIQNFAAYGVSKFALEGLSKYLAMDVGTSGIAVVSILVGSVKTDMTSAALPWEVVQTLPPPESVAPVFLFASTAPARQVHGRVLASWRFQEPFYAEAILNGPLASVPPLSFQPLVYKGQEVHRTSSDVAVFDRAENQYGASPVVTRTVIQSLQSLNVARYPDDRYAKLRGALSVKHQLPSECFTIGNGSSELVERVLRVFLHPGEEVLSNNPGWFVFDRFCARYGVTNQQIPFEHAPYPSRTGHNLKLVLSSIGVNTRLIYLISPSNPVGVPLYEKEFQEFLKEVDPHIPVVVDEAYADYSDHPEMFRTDRAILETDRMLICLRTFSKFYGLANFRIGYGMASARVIELLDRLQLPFACSTVAEEAAVAALNDLEHQHELLTHVKRERQRIQAWCFERQLDFIESESCMMLIESPCDPLKLYGTYEAQGVFLPKGIFFDKYLLFPIGTPEQNTRNLEILASLL